MGRRLFKQFCVGDLVSWKELGSYAKCYGFIKKIYLKELSSGRAFVMVVVINIQLEEKEYYAGMLNLEAKSFKPQ